MFHTLFYIVLIMGPNVLITYVEAFRSLLAAQLWGGLPRTTWYKNPWIVSMILTVVSYLYMTGMWVFDLYEAPIYNQIGLQKYVALSYVSFMTGAILWAPYTLVALHRRQKMLTVALALWLTALGSVGMFILACGLKEQPWMVVASTICMLHHVGFDAIYWWVTFVPSKKITPTTENINKLIY